MTIQPTQLALEGSQLTIQWSDGRTLVYDTDELRRRCPCASCRQEQAFSAGQEESAGPGPLGATIQQMSPVGNYAYKILFSDGHDTGIYTLGLLRSLGREKTGR